MMKYVSFLIIATSLVSVDTTQDGDSCNLKKSKKYKKKANTDNIKFDREEPLVIIGGGIAGSYLGWRLATADDSEYKPDQIHTYERTDYIGGKILSQVMGESLCTASDRDPSENFLPRADFGSMRIRTKDGILMGLVDELDIKTAPLYMNSENEENQQSDSAPVWARNALGTYKDFFFGTDKKIPFTTGVQSFDGDLPYTPQYDGLPENKIPEKGYNPCDGKTNAEYLMKPYGPTGDPYYSYSSVEAEHEFNGETPEFRQYLASVIGYPITHFDYGWSSDNGKKVVPKRSYSYRRPLRGMGAIPISLNKEATDLGVKTTMNQEVIRVEHLGTNDWLITLRETSTSSCTGITKMKQGAEFLTVLRAKRVILALPTAALSRIEFADSDSSGSLNQKIQSLVSKITQVPLFKIFAAWPERWWNVVNNLDTFSTTEMPKLLNERSTNFTAGLFLNDFINQLVAWYPGSQLRQETVDENASACSKMGILQLYSMPARHPKFGAATRDEAQNECPENDDCAACDPNRDTTNSWFSPGISTRLAKLVKQDLSTIFRLDVPDASEIKYRMWDQDDPVTRTAGVHFWKAGVKWWEIYTKALVPIEDDSLHIVGEAYSSQQGWLEGALETSEHLMQEIFQMNRPTWLSREDYCHDMPYYLNRATEA
mmetsp:Transcript_38854/g.75773  ORF Transcript_38854/g.75773 Transcript_38854/m.75773 type:complete len:656 (-) Transcript_38854:297-2264(-)